MKIAHHPYVAASVFAALSLSACNSPKPHPTDKEVAAAEDEVYETLARPMTTSVELVRPTATTPVNGQPGTTQLVFDDTLLTLLEPGGDLESCERSTRKTLSLETGPPPYDSLADKAYRFFAQGDSALHDEAIESFLKRSCTPGRLSQTFHQTFQRIS